jgi:hypothetical protein
MAITAKDIIDFIVANGSMGNLLTEETIEMPIVLNYNEDGTANTELHTFKISAISLVKEDLTQKRKNAEAIIASL